MTPAYAPLWCKSNYSFLEGASHPAELVEEAHHLGLRALALTDRNGLYGIVRAHVAARELGVKLLLGATVDVADQVLGEDVIVLLVMNRTGYANLCRLLTRGHRRAARKGEPRMNWREVGEHAEGLLALWAGGNRWGESRAAAGGDLEAARLKVTRLLQEAFPDRLYGLIARHRQAEELAQETARRTHFQRCGIAEVAALEVLYHSPARRPLQDVLTCIRHGLRLAAAGRGIRPNAEHALLAPRAFARLFHDLPGAVQRTEEVARRCEFTLDEISYRYPEEDLPAGRTTRVWLRELAFQGARRRYGARLTSKVKAQLEHELEVVEKLDYGGYFLTMWEIVEFCRKRGILCQGRGSAANSALCYCLGITAIDPVRMDLLFERFLSEERAEPPDIDLDIANDRREEVIQHVYSKYGRDHAAMVANVIRYRPRSAIREVGKVLGIAPIALDRLAKMVSHHESISADLLRRAGLDPGHEIHRHLADRVEEVIDFPRHLSIHPGGFLLGREPVEELVPIENATMEGRTVIQWDKEDIEALGLFKVDLLGLGALAQLDGAFALLEQRGKSYSMATIPADDAATYRMIRKADTVGVFQIESRAQMAMLPRLRPRSYYDLVVEISIVRPGPITGGMVHPYLRRRQGLEAVVYPHEKLRSVLEKTLGVPLFQEQVMKVAMIAADYTPGEADQLRRDMAAWRRSGRMEQHRERLIRRMQHNGIEKEFAERVFQQICGFGEYGFPESHAASFALISYASAWIKCHYPAEFLCATLNAYPLGFYSPATLIEDARRHGVEVLGVDVMQSEWACSMVERRGTWAVRLGLRHIKGLARESGRLLLALRAERPFPDLADLVWRGWRIPGGELLLLAEAGALEPLQAGRREALWALKGLLHARRAALPQYPGRRGRVLPDERDWAAMPWFFAADGEVPPELRPLDSGETIEWDYRAGRLSVQGHPLSVLRRELGAHGWPTARVVGRMRHGTFARYAGLVICRQRPGNAAGVTFLTLEDETGFVNVVVWKRVFQAHAVVIKTAVLLAVAGKIQAESGVVHLIAESLWVPELSRAPDSAGSRDFH